MPTLKVIISGGGTGGHIFPAIAIANAIKSKHPDAEILFVGAQGRMEMEKVPASGYEIKGLWISGLQRSLSLRNLLFPVKVLSSIIKAWVILRRFRPDVVVGVGGYASGPTLFAAVGAGIPTLIQEQNSFPGITNRILAKKVKRICVAFEGMQRYFPKEKIALTGNPVRMDIIRLEGKRDEALEHFGLDSARKVLLVIGGSLGARTINKSVKASLEQFKKMNLQVIWQTGKGYFPDMKMAAAPYEQYGIKVFDFISKMDLAYSIADVVVSRAGAIAVSELCIAGKAAILIPSPNVAEDHQTKNAMALVNRGAALLLKDSEAVEKLALKVSELLGEVQLLEKLRKNIAQLALSNAADDIAGEVIALSKMNL